MCGIVGFVGASGGVDAILSGLQRLEYRGYDSSGIAVLTAQKDMRVCRAVGDFSALKKKLPVWHEPCASIGHTRWATHGKPSIENTHPLSSHSVSLVHNGIVENAQDLRSFLEEKRYVFSSQTDTESIVHLLDWYYQQTQSIPKSMHNMMQDLKGSYAIACLFKDRPDILVAARCGTAPLLVGYGKKCMSISSDPLGLPESITDISEIPSGTWAIIGEDSIVCCGNAKGDAVVLKKKKNPAQYTACQRDGFAHFMLKEIYEQPAVIERLMSYPASSFNPKRYEHATLLGCGTSFYAAWAGKYFLEKKMSVSLELASEFHYRRPAMLPGMVLALSQSGETADTLKAMDYAKTQGRHLACVTNSAHSTLARMSDSVFFMHAGTEVGVASTKSFTAQLWILLSMSGLDLVDICHDLPLLIKKTIDLSDQIRDMALSIQHSASILYVGRGVYYPIALEGALKMKELSYIHAEGMAAGELKHGSIALIDENRPVVVVAPYDDRFNKTLSTLYEIDARKGRLIVMTDSKGAGILQGTGISYRSIVLPTSKHVCVPPFLSVVALQLLAYYTALLRGCAIDKPRNLAKSVTVE